MADDAMSRNNLDKDIDRLIQITGKLYEQLQGMGVTWSEAELIWLNLGSIIFTQGSKVSMQDASEKMRKCVEGWAQS
ncbi:MAG: hypothetical protein JW838_00100 [Spirochaetes bacterium]|nr:hypothetical protein [Spirochaetota bacterium]